MTATDDLGVWTSDACALVLIDCQNEMFEVIRSETNAALVELNGPTWAIAHRSGGRAGGRDCHHVLDRVAPPRRSQGIDGSGSQHPKLLIALYVGLSIPVVGAGIALDQGASIPNTVLGFAILVALGVTASGWALLRPRQSPETRGDQRPR
jgi:hypothetical protein